MMIRPRLSAVVILSFVVSCIAIYSAFRKQQQFYPTMVYIGRSNLTLAVIYFQIFVISVAVVCAAKSLFFGNLRNIEIEHLMDRTWYAVTETCLAFTVFRDDFNAHFIAMFMVLLIVKCAHWLADDRVEYAEQTPSLQPRFHNQIRCLLCFLILLDISFPVMSLRTRSQQVQSVQLVFGFEYAILMISALSTAMKYCLYEIDRHSDHQWEDKGTFLLYSELVTNLFRVLVYTCFVIIMVRLYTIPLFIVRPMFMSFMALKKSINDVIQARQAIINLNNMYPDATDEDFEVRNSDRTCIICRDEMQVTQILKRLPCNHIFHRSCLRSWFQRQQTCPTCRTDILSQSQTQARQRQAPQPSNSESAAPNQGSAAADRQASSAQPSHVPAFESSAVGANSGPRLILPPYLFPPPPLPEVVLSPSDTLEHLCCEEQSEQERVLARIETLRNIRCLLDASFIHLNMYLNMNPDDDRMINKLRSSNTSNQNRTSQMNLEKNGCTLPFIEWAFRCGVANIRFDKWITSFSGLHQIPPPVPLFLYPNKNLFKLAAVTFEDSVINFDGFLSFRHLCASSLKQISLIRCPHVCDRFMALLAVRFKNLDSICIEDCKNVTKRGYGYLAAIRSLHAITIEGITSNEDVSRISQFLSNKLSDCQIRCNM